MSLRWQIDRLFFLAKSTVRKTPLLLVCILVGFRTESEPLATTVLPQSNGQEVTPNQVSQLENLLSNGAFVDAITLGEKAINTAPDDIAVALLTAKAYILRGQSAKTDKDFDSALAILLLLQARGVADAAAFELFGEAYEGLKRRNEALNAYQKSVELDVKSGRALFRLGWMHRETGQYDAALKYFLQAGALARELPDSSLPIEEAEYEAGFTYALLGAYKDAQERMRLAEAAASDVDKPKYRKFVEFADNLASPVLTIAARNAHKDLFVFHVGANRYDLGIEESKRMIPAELTDEWRGNEAMIGWAYERIALLYDTSRNFDAAESQYKTAIEWYEKGNDEKKTGRAYVGLGNLYEHLGSRLRLQVTDADVEAQLREYKKKGLAAYEAALPHLEKANDMEILDSLPGSISYLRARMFGIDDPFVRKFQQERTKAIEQSKLPLTGGYAQNAIALADLLEIEFGQETEASIRMREKAMGWYNALPPEQINDTMISEYTSLARGYKKVFNDIPGAIRYYEQAVEKGEQLRALRKSDSYRRSGTSLWLQSAYCNLVHFYGQRGDAEKAFEFGEQYKGRALLDLLGSEGTAVRRQFIAEGAAKSKVAQSRIDELRQQIDRPKTGRMGKSVRSLKRTLEIETTAYQRLAQDVSVANLEIENADTVKVTTWREMGEALQDATYVNYVIHPEEMCSAIVADKSGIKVIALTLENPRMLHTLIKRLHEELGITAQISRDLAVEAGQKANSKPETHETPASQELHRLLIAPILPEIKTARVIISPYDVLNYLPFEALQDANGRYFIEAHIVSYTPNASVLKLCMDKQRTRKESVLALGNPNLQNPEFRLFNAEDEVRALKKMYVKSEVLTFDDATESALKKFAPNYDIVHFACHGELNLDEPMLTSLRLAPDAENDGYLHAGEVFELKLRASLVVLSACNSALGELKAGNELMGLTRSFLYAGTPSIIASLWKVDDRSTSFLMQRFYTHLQTTGKADALRQAKLDTMKKFPSPYHWAAFCLQGDYR